MTPEARLTAVELFLKNTLGYTIPTDPVIPTPTDYTEITDFSVMRSGGKYKLKPTSLTLQQSIVVPNDTTLDLTGSTVDYSGQDWSSIFALKENVTIIGGTYKTARKNTILDAQNCKNIILKDMTMAEGSGGGYRIAGGENITIDGFKAKTWYNYCAFIEGNAKNVTIKNWVVKGGSENESTIRVCGCTGLLIRDCILHEGLNPIGAKKSVAMRLHEGSDYTLENIEVRGNFGVGPMGGGDGGQNWATYQWIDKNGKWYVPKEQADMTKTLEQRAKTLALRTNKVRIKNVRVIEGKCQINAGAVDVIWDGGSITNTTQPEQPNWPAHNYCFYGYTSQYPDGKSIYSTLLPTDKPRPAPDITIHNLQLVGSLEDVKGYVKVGSGNTLNGKVLQ